MNLSRLSHEDLHGLKKLLDEKERRSREPLRTFRPYQKQNDFYALQKDFAEVCMLAGNQCGKTLCACVEAAYHALGEYPADWPGIVFEKPPVIWICGETGEVIRDTMQKYLVGRPGELQGDNLDIYTGLIPKRSILDYKTVSNSNGLLDYLVIKHKAGKAFIYFKAYSKGRQKFQGETIDMIFLDEEPPHEIYSEGITRTNKGQLGRKAVLTFTPLLGMSDVVYSFLEKPSNQQAVVNMTINDVDHYTQAEREAIIAGYPEHEREARANGLPIMGSGRVFQVPESAIKEERIEPLPNWWRKIAGIDFGWDHPSAAVLMLLDPETDCVHVRSCYKASESTPLMFSIGVRSWGNETPWAWPHDGLQHDKGSGKQLALQYRDAGLNMLPEKATFTDGTNGVEAGIMEMLDRMKTGRFKVDESLHEWFQEFRLYHRKNGVIQKINDDLLCATRYAIMMLRFAVPVYEMQDDTIIPQEALPEW